MTIRHLPGGRPKLPMPSPGLRDGDLPAHTSWMANFHDIKPDARRLVDNLPDGSSWDDLMYEIYVRQAVEAGVADADARRLVEHDSAMARIRARIRRAS